MTTRNPEIEQFLKQAALNWTIQLGEFANKLRDCVLEDDTDGFREGIACLEFLLGQPPPAVLGELERVLGDHMHVLMVTDPIKNLSYTIHSIQWSWIFAACATPERAPTVGKFAHLVNDYNQYLHDWFDRNEEMFRRIDKYLSQKQKASYLRDSKPWRPGHDN